MKMGPTGCPKMLVTNYQSMLCNIPEEQKSHLHHGGSLIIISNNFCGQKLKSGFEAFYAILGVYKYRKTKTDNRRKVTNTDSSTLLHDVSISVRS
jgi:hypothetical protein